MACGQQTVKMTISITRLPNEKYGAISSSFDSIFLPNKIFVQRSLLRLSPFEKNRSFWTSLNIQHRVKEAPYARNFCRTPKFSTSNVFFIPVKKIMLRIWKTEMDSDFEKFENFDFF